MSNILTFDADEQASFRHAGGILRACLDMVAGHVRPGITTGELDSLAENFITDHEGAMPAFKGYYDYPATLCTSVNEGCVHGIPGDVVLEEGDIVSIDCGVRYDGLNTDACVTVGVGEITDEAQHLLTVTEGALKEVVKIIKEGTKTGDISAFIQDYAEERNCKPVRSLTGHGLGRGLHEYPDIPNIGTADTGPALPAGTVIAVEPILSLGANTVVDSDDGWTLNIKDGALSAHFEHTLLVTPGGVEIIA